MIDAPTKPCDLPKTEAAKKSSDRFLQWLLDDMNARTRRECEAQAEALRRDGSIA